MKQRGIMAHTNIVRLIVCKRAEYIFDTIQIMEPLRMGHPKVFALTRLDDRSDLIGGHQVCS